MVLSFVRFFFLGLLTNSLLSPSASLAMETDTTVDRDYCPPKKRMRKSDGGSFTTDRYQTRHKLKHKQPSSFTETEDMDVENQDNSGTLTTIPYEVKYDYLFPNLTLEELLSLRLTCKGLKGEIDDYAIHRRPLEVIISLGRLNAWCRQEANNQTPLVYKYFRPENEMTERAMSLRMRFDHKQHILHSVYQVPIDRAEIEQKTQYVARNRIVVREIEVPPENDIDSSAFQQVIHLAREAKTKIITLYPCVMNMQMYNLPRNPDRCFSESFFRSLRECPDLEMLRVPVNSMKPVFFNRMEICLAALCEVLPHTNLRYLNICGWKSKSEIDSYNNLKKLFTAVKNSNIQYLDITETFSATPQILTQLLPLIRESGLKKLFVFVHDDTGNEYLPIHLSLLAVGIKLIGCFDSSVLINHYHKVKVELGLSRPQDDPLLIELLRSQHACNTDVVLVPDPESPGLMDV